MANPTILDTLNLTPRGFEGTNVDSFTYTVPAGGVNKLFVMLVFSFGSAPVATLNGSSLTFVQIATPGGGWQRATNAYYGYLAAPTTGTLSYSQTSNSGSYIPMTLQDAVQSSPADVTGSASVPGLAITINLTTTLSTDLVLSFFEGANSTTFSSYGTGQTEIVRGNGYPNGGSPYKVFGAYRTPGTGATTMDFTAGAGGSTDGIAIAIKYLSPAVGPTNVKTWDGVTQSTGIKTYKGVTLASVKSVEGVT